MSSEDLLLGQPFETKACGSAEFAASVRGEPLVTVRAGQSERGIELRIRLDRQRDRQTDRKTDRQADQ